MQQKIDFPMLLIFTGLLVYTGLLIYIARRMPNDGQTFMAISTVMGNFSGALFMRINPKTSKDDLKQAITEQKQDENGSNGGKNEANPQSPVV